MNYIELKLQYMQAELERLSKYASLYDLLTSGNQNDINAIIPEAYRNLFSKRDFEIYLDYKRGVTDYFTLANRHDTNVPHVAQVIKALKSPL